MATSGVVADSGLDVARTACTVSLGDVVRETGSGIDILVSPDVFYR